MTTRLRLLCSIAGHRWAPCWIFGTYDDPAYTRCARCGAVRHASRP